MYRIKGAALRQIGCNINIFLFMFVKIKTKNKTIKADCGTAYSKTVSWIT